MDGRKADLGELGEREIKDFKVAVSIPAIRMCGYLRLIARQSSIYELDCARMEGIEIESGSNHSVTKSGIPDST